MFENKTIYRHIDKLKGGILNLKNTVTMVDDVGQPILLLNSLMRSYDNLTVTIIFKRSLLCMEEVKMTLLSWKLRGNSSIQMW